jgi:hypothetical protein
MHGGVTPMPKTQTLMVENGATAENWFIHTPICCPSRSELVTGRYYHNLKKTGLGCMHIDEDKVNNQTFAAIMHEHGYTVGMFGKYLNNCPDASPVGIDAYMANGGGNYNAPSFATQGVSDLAPYYMEDGHWHGKKTDYTTAVVGNASISWIKKVAKAGRPFLAYIAPKACHMPFTPAPWYSTACTIHYTDALYTILMHYTLYAYTIHYTHALYTIRIHHLRVTFRPGTRTTGIAPGPTPNRETCPRGTAVRHQGPTTTMPSLPYPCSSKAARATSRVCSKTGGGR